MTTTLEAIALFGGLLLVFVLCLSLLPTLSGVLVKNPESEEARRSWEGGCLLLLAFVMMLLILIWRAA